jgi:hypothetical protein
MKRGGSKMGYTAQFNLLSPCYKDGEQPAGFHMGGVKAKPTKKGKATKKRTKAKSSKQRGGSSCYASPSVSEMGVVDKPASNQPTASELAWDNRMKGGGLNANGVNGAQPANGARLANGAQPANGANGANGANLAQLVVENNSKKNTQLNNISTYLNKVKEVVFDKGTKTGFAIIVEKTTEDPLNPKNDKYNIKVIKTINNTPSMTVLSEQQFSEVSQTVRTTPFDVFPLKKTTNNKAKTKNNSFGTLNYGIPNNNSKTTNGTVQVKANGTGTTQVKAKANANANTNANANANAQGTVKSNSIFG